LFLMNPSEPTAAAAVAVPRGDEADLVCNECNALIRTVPASEGEQMLTQLAPSDELCSARCPHCEALNVFVGFSIMEAFTCSECGEGVAVEHRVRWAADLNLTSDNPDSQLVRLSRNVKSTEWDSMHSDSALINATAMSMTDQKSETNFDREWLATAVTRWKVGAEFVFFLDRELLPTEHPLRQFLGQDFPKVVRELAKLRPNLLT
jgi:hypothetical protein